MAEKGVCEVCGFADDSYRIDENGTVMKVCKFCHDGYMERMGLSPDADKPVDDVALTLDIEPLKEQGIDTEGLSGAEMLQLKMELEERKNKRVQTLDEKQLGELLAANEDYGTVLKKARQKEQRRKKKAAEAGLDDSGEDYTASEELIRSGEELLKAVEDLENIDETDEMLDEAGAPLIAKIVAPLAETRGAEEEGGKAEEESASTAEEKPDVAPEDSDSAQEIAADTTKEPEREENKTQIEKQTEEPIMSAKKTKTEIKTEEKVDKQTLVREKIHAEANQTIDDERIKITSPEVALSKDKRPKTNLDVAISEQAGGVRFLDAFKYVMHKVSYSVFLGLIVLAVATVIFIRESWQHGLIVFGGGVGAVLLGFLLMWYLSHCYELDRRALLLRIRQQEILFESMNSDCYRELRTKFTMIKAFGWLLNKLSVLLPLVTVIGGNVAAVIVTFILEYFWLLPVVSAAASVAGVLVYYIVKFGADWIAYALDRERNQQIQQQTMLDILSELKKK